MSISFPPYKIPIDFQLVETEFKCTACGYRFVCRSSPDNVLVKFVDQSNMQERWLPTFEKGGYLDVVEKCVDEFQRDQEITMPVFHKFEREFQSFQHPPETGGFWAAATGCRCPNCRGTEYEALAEQILNNANVEWLIYDPIK